MLAFDYRGFGLSDGVPSEEGLLKDALAVVDWAVDKAGIPPSRIVLYAQSLGTAVAISLAQHLAETSPDTSFAGLVMTASFSDVATLTATYRIGGVIPVLSPLAKFPWLLNWFQKFLTSTWSSRDRIASYIKMRESAKTGGHYDVTFIHSEDDSDIACVHSDVLFWHAVNATILVGVDFETLGKQKITEKVSLGEGGWMIERRGTNGVIRQEMVKHGLHDKIMSYPVVGRAILRAFQSSVPT